MRAAVVLLLAPFVSYVVGDLFTSVADMQNLLDSEKAIPAVLQKYIEEEESRLNGLKKLAERYQQRNEDSIATGNKDITNPINAFLMIKRKIFDWKEIEQQMNTNKAQSFIDRMTNANYGVRYPTQEDLTGAATGILRLQDTYRLDPRDLSEGRIQQVQGNYTFDSNDCFEIGRSAYNDEDYYHTILWMEEARRQLDREEETLEAGYANKEDVLEYLAYSLYKQGNLKHALKYTDELYAMNPEHPRAKGNVKWYEDLLQEEGVKKKDMRRSIGNVRNSRPASVLGNKERTMYEALCRGEIPVSDKDVSKLYCYYKRDRPFLVYAPIKIEIMRFNPLAVLFKDVITDEEIDLIQELSAPRLARATVHDAATGKLVTANYRISKSAWLKDWEHEVVHRINQRIDYMTNLDQETAEELQVQNYGIGGHYDPHFDHARKEESKSFESLGTGNRIATVLLYMSQTQLGGSTVFTDAKSTINVSKNDALFWYNLYRQGDGNPMTRHAGCPVLVGIKWVANKWIHERQNEFRRPCGLKPSDNERFVGDLGVYGEPRTTPNLSPVLSKDIWDTI
ncbi:unnamed protein product [Auanema sp. JU1783]|nr:unnamed protein product [Auanema sp. JU1783]